MKVAYYCLMSTTPTTPPNCPFCRSNGLLRGEVLAETEGGFMVATDFDAHLIIPNVHAESLSDLPDTWWQDFKTLFAQVPGLPESYNLSLNVGKNAGQSVKHLHFWIIPREGGKPSSGKGLARFIADADNTEVEE